MTEYNLSHPPYQENQRWSDVTQERTEAYTRRTLQSSIESFEAALDGDHEMAIRVASPSPFEFCAQEIMFSPSNIVIFKGNTPTGEPVQLVQHLSQVAFVLTAVKKARDRAQRVTFRHA